MALTSLTKEINKEKEINKTYDYIVVDGMNMSFKYFYGLQSLSGSNGEHTGLYHGFLSMILKLKKEHPNTNVIVAWEGDNLVRKATRESYKANREAKPDNLTKSIAKLKEYLGMLGVCQKYSPGYEADDIAAYYCDKFNGDKKILLVSEDSDWLQVVNENCCIMKKSKEYNYDQLLSMKGFPPERILLYKMIKGDSKDNVFGVPYFPTKLALEIVKNCDNLNKAFKYIPQDKRYISWMKKLISCRSLLTDNYEILKLRSDIRLEDLPCREKKNIVKLKKVLIEMKMYRVLNQVKKM